MSSGVIYYNKGTKCLIRLFVSLFSLRKVYDGPVTVVLEGEQEEHVFDILKELGVGCAVIEDTGNYPLVTKTILYRYSPYDKTLFIDADTIVMKPIDGFFSYLDENDFVVTDFCEWKTTGGMMSQRIKKWSGVCPEYMEDALAYGKAVNTGVFGFRKDAKIFEEWYDVTKRGYEAGTGHIPDELACQILLPRYEHLMVDRSWNESGKFNLENWKETTKIMHFHGRKHCGDRDTNLMWKRMYWGMRNSIRSVDTRLLENPNGDRSFRDYMKGLKDRREKMCFVTAVNEKYLPKLLNNFPIWQQTEGMMEYEFVVLWKGGIDTPDPLMGRRNVTWCDWEFSVADNEREEMLSAFVFGTADCIKKLHWFKVDADTTPKGDKLTITDEMFDYGIVGHKWGYTKIKADDRNEKHWLNVLDEWWKEKTGEEPIFPQIEGRTHRHERVASFCQLQTTEFTKYVAKLCGERMPIPSHDTLYWYIATRCGIPIMRHNFKKEMAP